MGPRIVLADLTFFLVPVRAGRLGAAALELGIRWRPPASAVERATQRRGATSAAAGRSVAGALPRARFLCSFAHGAAAL
jgi:hypothetical protein